VDSYVASGFASHLCTECSTGHTLAHPTNAFDPLLGLPINGHDTGDLFQALRFLCTHTHFSCLNALPMPEWESVVSRVEGASARSE
jgi:hypothetical protein